MNGCASRKKTPPLMQRKKKAADEFEFESSVITIFTFTVYFVE